MNKYQRGYTSIALIIPILYLLGIIGWVANIVQIVNSISNEITLLLILKCIGIVVAPLGVILGWIGIF